MRPTKDPKDARSRPAIACQLLLAFAFAAVDARGNEPPTATVSDSGAARIPKHTVFPGYPQKAVLERIEGDVEVCFFVSRAGKPYRVAVRRSDHRLFERPSRNAVKASSFEPLGDAAELPPVKTCRTFRFRLEAVKPPLKQDNPESSP